MKKSLNELLKTFDMKLHVFDGRYSEGFICILTNENNEIVIIEDLYTDGDSTWIQTYSAINSLEWFPIIYTENLKEAIPQLEEKISKIQIVQNDEEFAIWCDCISVVCQILSTRNFEKISRIKDSNSVNIIDTLKFLNFIKNH
jgi:hypothetical protein